MGTIRVSMKMNPVSPSDVSDWTHIREHRRTITTPRGIPTQIWVGPSVPFCEFTSPRHIQYLVQWRLISQRPSVMSKRLLPLHCSDRLHHALLSVELSISASHLCPYTHLPNYHWLVSQVPMCRDCIRDLKYRFSQKHSFLTTPNSHAYDWECDVRFLS